MVTHEMRVWYNKLVRLEALINNATSNRLAFKAIALHNTVMFANYADSFESILDNNY